MNSYKTIYWLSTAVMAVLFLGSIYLNVFRTDQVQEFFETLNFPTWLILPSALLKVLALVAIFTRKSKFLKEWAYAGLFFDAIMAFSAHMMSAEGGGLLAFIAALATMSSRIFEEKVYPNG